MTNKIKVKNPHGAVVIYNYRERFGSKYLPGNANIPGEPPYEIDQIILNSASLLSITTQKGKASPHGSFEIKLAPYKNWTSAITPGSWCIILMSNSAIDDGAKTGGSKVSPRSFKMLGRIESVRGVVATNALDGAIGKHYIVTGSDWGCIFNSSLYVDPLSRDANESALGLAQRWGYGDYLEQVITWKKTKTKEAATKKQVVTPDKSTQEALSDQILVYSQNEITKQKNLSQLESESKEKSSPVKIDRPGNNDKTGLRPTSIKNIDALIKLWGSTGDISTTNKATSGKLLGDAQHQFKIPDLLAKYMRFQNENNETIVDIASLVECIKYSGRLVGKDQYSGLNEDSDIGLINFDTIFGEHSIWQVLTENYNELTSELIADVRFTNNKPELVLYNRVKPFAISSSIDTLISDSYSVENVAADGSSSTAASSGNLKKEDVRFVVERNFSKFKNVRHVEIGAEDVIVSSFGTNWRDKINFIEVSINKSLLFGESYSTALKLDSQFYDKRSISRDGLRSLRQSTAYVPATNEGLANPISAFAYKYLLKEWFFDTHTMLNGTLQLVGQDQYIQVGDNIKINAKVLDINRNFNISQNTAKGDIPIYLLAHVESIGHSMSYEGDGRVFHTTINFVRGILVDAALNPINSYNKGAVDQDSSQLSPAQEVNSRMSGSSSSTDPDSEKLGYIKQDEGTVVNISSEDSEPDVLFKPEDGSI